jgi:hypothetical protein
MNLPLQGRLGNPELLVGVAVELKFPPEGQRHQLLLGKVTMAGMPKQLVFLAMVAAAAVLARLAVVMCLEIMLRQGAQVLLLIQFGAQQLARVKM